jgi:hypothetical protein
MNDDRKYVRVYYSIIDDWRFAHVYSDDAALAAWLRMLLDADALWPASASLPKRLSARVLRILTDSGLIEVTGTRFRVHGLDTERKRRSEVGRAGGLASGRSRSAGTGYERTFNDRPTNVERTPGTKTNLAEQSRDETSRDEQSRADARPDVEAFLGTRFHLPTPAQRTFMDTYCQIFDQTGPERAAQLIWSHPDDPIGAMKEDLTAFRASRKAEALEAEVPKPRRRNGSGMSKVSDELAKVFLTPPGCDVPIADLVTPEALAAAGRKP